jgi:hypothetical protein
MKKTFLRRWSGTNKKMKILMRKEGRKKRNKKNLRMRKRKKESQSSSTAVPYAPNHLSVSPAFTPIRKSTKPSRTFRAANARKVSAVATISAFMNAFTRASGRTAVPCARNHFASGAHCRSTREVGTGHHPPTGRTDLEGSIRWGWGRVSGVRCAASVAIGSTLLRIMPRSTRGSGPIRSAFKPMFFL